MVMFGYLVSTSALLLGIFLLAIYGFLYVIHGYIDEPLALYCTAHTVFSMVVFY